MEMNKQANRFITPMAALVGLSCVTAGGIVPKNNHAPTTAKSSITGVARTIAQSTSMPEYVENRREFTTVTTAQFLAKDKGKETFSGNTVEALQACPLGFIGAESPTIRDYEMQRVFKQKFTVNGVELKFIAHPKPTDANYWTLTKERNYGWDINKLVFNPEPGSPSITIEAEYTGLTGTNYYNQSGGSTGIKLTALEEKKFLNNFRESAFETSKEEVRAFLSNYDMLRRSDEKPVEYATRLAGWITAHKSYKPSHSENNIFKSIRDEEFGNCNDFARNYQFCLRGNEIPARMVSGMNGVKRQGHAVCEFFDDSTDKWYRMGVNDADINPLKYIGRENSDIFAFQIDSTFDYITSSGEGGVTGGSGCGEWCFFQNDKLIGGEFGRADLARSYDRPATGAQNAVSNIVFQNSVGQSFVATVDQGPWQKPFGAGKLEQHLEGAASR